MITVKVNVLYTQYNGYYQQKDEQRMAQQMCRIGAEGTVGEQIEAVLTHLANKRGEVYENAMCWMRDCNGQTMDEQCPIMDGGHYEMGVEVAYD